jgi:hypothetical protein
MVDPQPFLADDGADPPEPPALRRLRWLVTALTVVMIVGVVTIVGVLVLRITQPAATHTPGAVNASRIVVPAGETITATGGGGGTVSVVTEDGAGVERLRVYDADNGEPTGTVLIERRQR